MKCWDDARTPFAISGLNIKFTSLTVCGVVQKCSHLDALIPFFHWLGRSEDFELNSHAYSALIHRLGKAGMFKEMEEVASHAVEDGKVSVSIFNALLHHYGSVKDLNGALRAWKTMIRLKVQPTAVTYTIMMDTYAKMKLYEEAGECFFQLLHSGITPTIKTYSTLIYHLIEAGNLDAAIDMFNSLPKVNLHPNRVTYAILMMGYAKAGDMNAAYKLMEDFKEFGHSPFNIGESFRSTLLYLVKEGKIEEARKLMEVGWPGISASELQDKIIQFQGELVGDGSSTNGSFQTDSNVHIINNSLDKEGEWGTGNIASYQVQCHNVFSLSQMHVFVDCLGFWSPNVVNALNDANIQWDCPLVLEVLGRMKRVDSAWKFYRWVGRKQGYNHDRYTCGLMIQRLLKSQNFSRIKYLFNQAEKDNIILPKHIFKTILKQSGIKKQANFAIKVFEKLKASGFVPDEQCYKNYIHTLYNCGRHWRVASVCSEMRNAGYSLDSTMYSFLIAGFARAGKLSIAKRLAAQMRALGFKPDVLMLSSLVVVFYRCGDFKKAERVYKGMRECGMNPPLHICEIMVDILSDLGKIKEAERLSIKIEHFSGHCKIIRDSKYESFLHFHSLFVNGFRGARTELALAAA
ncbi:hypothetical protein KP509_19G017900 [Ceratopteris richardii]|nr:hypothetical protein KP509_19G017900 [Ceratopteris richardii]